MKPRSRSIVKDSKRLRFALKRRWKQLKLTQDKVAEDAVSHGQYMNRQGISKYLGNPYAAGALNEEQILWLAARWQVYATLKVGRRTPMGKYTIPNYDEKEALEILYKLYPRKKNNDTQGENTSGAGDNL